MDRRQKHGLPSVTFDFSRLNKPVVVIIGLLVSLIIGYYNQTDIYDRLNALPEDRNEQTPIKTLSAHVNGNTIFAEVGVTAISQITHDNIFEHLSLHVSLGPLEMVIRAKNSSPRRTKNGFTFEARLPFNGTCNFRFFLFDKAVGDEGTAISEGAVEKNGYSSFSCGSDICVLSRVCVVNDSIHVYSPFEMVVLKPGMWDGTVVTEHGQCPSNMSPPCGLITHVGKKNDWDVVKKILEDAAVMNMSCNLVRGQEVPLNAFFGIRQINGSMQCFSDLALRYNVNREGSVLRDEVLRKVEEDSDKRSSRAVVLINSVVNAKELSETICPNCSIESVVAKSAVEVAKIVKYSDLVITGVGEMLPGLLAMEHGVTVVVATQFRCILYALDIQAMMRQRMIIYLTGSGISCTAGPTTLNVSQILSALNVDLPSDCTENLWIVNDNSISGYCGGAAQTLAV